MAGQGMERREVLRIMALAAAASGFPGFHRWSFACAHVGARPLQVRLAHYVPSFFTPDEYTTVERLADLIIPSDGTPGARDAGVAEFIDFMVASDPSVQYRIRYGLTWLDAHAQRLHGRPFRLAEAADQTRILEQLAYRERHRDGEETGRELFATVREYTIMGFYTTRIGLEQLDFPGLRFYAESPGCPHPDDPGHERLPPPIA